jgi:hypothetical protein
MDSCQLIRKETKILVAGGSRHQVALAAACRRCGPRGGTFQALHRGEGGTVPAPISRAHASKTGVRIIAVVADPWPIKVHMKEIFHACNLN